MKKFLRKVKNFMYFLLPNQFISYFESRIVRSYNELTSGEIEFFDLIADYVNTVVDVGARTDAHYATHASKNKVKRKVFMFEANPSFASKLRDITPKLNEDNFVINVAIGKEQGELFYFYDSQSLVEKSNVGDTSKIKSRKPIAVQTLDSYFETIKEIDFLKTDIEEMDFYALLGASKFLKRTHFIQFELGLGLPYLERKVENSDYWELLEPNFSLFILQDEANPIEKAFSKLPLLVALTPEVKMLMKVLQSLGYGFNVVGINKAYEPINSVLDRTGDLNKA